MTDPQAEAVAALAPILYAHSLESDEYGPWADISQTAGDEAREWTEAILDAIQQDQAAQAALVAVLAPPSPEPLDAELRASAIMVAIAQERERLRVAVEGLHTEAAVGIGGLHYRVKVVAKADVLALLSPDTGATTGGES